jgi:hypothetical protein
MISIMYKVLISVFYLSFLFRKDKYDKTLTDMVSLSERDLEKTLFYREKRNNKSLINEIKV